MAKRIVEDLRKWRHVEGFKRGLGRGLTLEEAAGLVLVGGRAVTRSTWWQWETGGKVPSPRTTMPVLLALTGLSSDIFFARPKPIETPKAPIAQLSMGV